jgi:predicted ribosomally synthesized peptide with nif11-like leader
MNDKNTNERNKNHMNSVEQFLQEVSQDKALQQQIQSLEKPESRVNKLVELGEKRGYNFTSTEVEDWLREKKQELSESELDAVAGGGIFTEGIAGLIGGTGASILGLVTGRNVGESFEVGREKMRDLFKDFPI